MRSMLRNRHRAAALAALLLAAVVAHAAFAGPVPPDVKHYKTNKKTTIQSWPALNASNRGTLAKGESFPLACQTYGRTQNGSPIWDLVYPDKGYVPDANVSTGSSGFVVGKCDGRLEPDRNDYPYGPWNGDGPVDEWNFFQHQCTSFAAWRIRFRMGIDFHNHWKTRWSDAKNWDDAARIAGVPVNRNATEGSIAQWNAGEFGHVAYVSAVHGDGTITVEEYNKNGNRSYGTRRISASNPDNYLHFRW